MKYIKARVKRFAGQISGAIFHSAIHSGPEEAPHISPGCSCICLFKKKDPKQGDQTDKDGRILLIEPRFIIWGSTLVCCSAQLPLLLPTLIFLGEHL